jgi:branched-chain amino acid transport system permease protein
VIPKIWRPWLLLAGLAVLAWPLMGSAAWLSLSVAGLGMGMLLFLMAVGLTLVFGLMDVLNFAHGAFVTLGACLAASVLAWLSGWMGAVGWLWNLAALGAALGAAALLGGAAGYGFERLLIRRVYGAPLRQILVTLGGLVVIEQIVIAVWGAEPLSLSRPLVLSRSLILGDAAIETYRLFAAGLGAVVFVGLHLLLTRTRIGLVVRAGVEDREMVEALGYRIGSVFVGVFMAGAALAAMAGALWAVYAQNVTASLGGDMMVLIFIVVIIGGLGSVSGCLLGGLTVGLLTNYVAFLAPKLALGANLALLIGVLLWRPRGLLPLGEE